MNVPFVVYDPETGDIRWSGRCAADQVANQARQGLAVLQAEASSTRHRVVDGAIVDKLVVRVDPSVDELRRRAYPQVENQLEMLWKAMDAGEIPKATEFYNAIKAVKDRYPKPS